MLGRLTKNLMMDRLLEDDKSVENDIFPAEPIFFGTTSCTDLHRLLQVKSAYCKIPVEDILKKYSSCTFT